MEVRSAIPDSYGGQLRPQASLAFPARRAEAPRAPAITAGVLKAREERLAYLQNREAKESRSMLRGLFLLSLLALTFTLVRVGADRAFFHGWWQQW